jgi:hypothetical protein
MMPSDLAFSLIAGVLFLLLVVLTCWLWCGGKTAPTAMKTPRARRAPKPFAGLTHKLDCLACAQEAGFSRRCPARPHPACSSPGGVTATSIPPGISAHIRLVRITAGSASGISVLTATPTDDAGGNSYV